VNLEVANQPDPSRLALVLGGGGARSAYQVGVLKALARRAPHLQIPLLTGVSAGAINIAHLANHTGPFHQQIDDLTELWMRLRLQDVFSTSGPGLLWRVLRIGMRLSVGLPPGIPDVHGMVDTQPLREFLLRAVGTPDGKLAGVERNLKSQRLQGVALTTLSYGTGNTTTFFRGRKINAWERPHRRSVETPLNVEHIMASAALPLFFPPVRIGNDWYGDGGIRLVSPLGPAVHMGADRILVISPHFIGETIEELPPDPPSPAVILAALYDAVFLDQLDQDVLQMQRINQIVEQLPPENRLGLREVKLFVIRPSQDLGQLAYGLTGKLPPMLRFLMERLGSRQAQSEDFMSTILFHHAYIERLIEIGEQDAELLGDELLQFVEGTEVTESSGAAMPGEREA
jgi:NTE family protein